MDFTLYQNQISFDAQFFSGTNIAMVWLFDKAQGTAQGEELIFLNFIATEGSWGPQVLSAGQPFDYAFVAMISGEWGLDNLTFNAVPIPASALLFAPGLLSILFLRRKNK